MSDSDSAILRLGTRGSLLARMQSQLVADGLMRRHPGLKVELTIVSTSGDQITDRPLHEFGGKGLFTKELEQALLSRRVDFAVHSYKDVPVTMPLVEQSNLVIAAVPKREDPSDVLVSAKAKSIGEMRDSARVGTGSLRRRCQLLAMRRVVAEPIRGNIDTRIRKLREGEFDAVILAMAGVKRAGLFDPAIMFPIPHAQMLPAAGQGALAIQCRADDAKTIALLGVLNDEATAIAVSAEREIVRLLNGDCHSPIAAYARMIDGNGARRIELRAVVGARDGCPPLLQSSNSNQDATVAVVAIINDLRSRGVDKLLSAGQ